MKKLKTFKFNVGLLIIQTGEFVRPRIWFLGVLILGIGYKVRGDMPYTTWKMFYP